MHMEISGEEVRGVLLDKVFKQEKEKCLQELNGQTVSMSLDGWSNIHNDPIICATVTTSAGKVYLIDSIDTSGHPHNTEYLLQITKETVSKCETEHNCLVRSLVTDNAANVKSMRHELEKDRHFDILTYGCSAHLLNLLGSDLQIPNVKEHIVYIVKYFRNNHFAAAKYKEEAGLKLVLPQDVRWNTMSDCLSNYVTKWPKIMKICEENRDKIDTNVYNKVINISLKRNAEELFKRLEPISKSLDGIQSDKCTISKAVHIWKKLEAELKDLKLDKNNMKKIFERYNEALGPPHFLAYLIDPRYNGNKLTDVEKKEALMFAKQKYSANFMLVLMKYMAKADPFHDFLFDENIVSQMSPLEWWNTHLHSNICATANDDNERTITKAVNQLLTATATSASVERIFSTFGLVQSTLRNKLGNEKAAKLVFLYKALNSGV